MAFGRLVHGGTKCESQPNSISLVMNPVSFQA